MKHRKYLRELRKFFRPLWFNLGRACILSAILLLPLASRATISLPGNPPNWLDYWTFDDTNTWATYKGYAPVDFTNITTCELGDYWTATLDSTNPAWLHYNLTEADGTNHFRVDHGSLMIWFAPFWAGTNEGGTGPGDWSRLIEVGAYTTNASYGWWSLYVDPEGANIYFAGQTNNGSEAIYATAPIEWTTNRWHHLGLTYSETNCSLYLDGCLVTNGLPVTYWPGPDVLAGGFYIGSDSNGVAQAHGMFDDLITYDYPVDTNVVFDTFAYSSIWYWANPLNTANYGVTNAPSDPGPLLSYDAITGPGYLEPLGAMTNCITDAAVWLTNIVATAATNGTMNITFSIAGGQDGAAYDVFANAVLGPTTATNYNWAWMGQGQHCQTYMMTNLPMASAYLLLGTPLDSDFDGLTDAYELLVSHTEPYKPDSDGDGTSDSDEVLNHTDPNTPDLALPSSLSVLPCPQ